MALTESPYLLYSDGEGNIFEDETLYVVGRAGWDAYPLPEEDWIPLRNSRRPCWCLSEYLSKKVVPMGRNQ